MPIELEGILKQAAYFLNFSDVKFRFDRDWKKIEDFVGSKTVIQVLKNYTWWHFLKVVDQQYSI